MNDITHKRVSSRMAHAIGKVTFSSHTFDLISKNQLPKGNLFDVARAAAMLGAKQTPALIPHCHPVSIDCLNVQFTLLEEPPSIEVHIEAKSISRTGIEIEAMTAASVAALTIYDLLKPVDKNLSIENIRLIQKKGGYSHACSNIPENIKANILVCSDSTSRKERIDQSGKLLQEKLGRYQVNIEDFKVVPDNIKEIQNTVNYWLSQNSDFIFISGGTGLSPRDVTREALLPLFDKEAIGIGEAMRSFGYERTPYAAFSNSFAGVIKDTVIIAMPGSPRAVDESLDALLPELFHLRGLLKGKN